MLSHLRHWEQSASRMLAMFWNTILKDIYGIQVNSYSALLSLLCILNRGYLAQPWGPQNTKTILQVSQMLGNLKLRHKLELEEYSRQAPGKVWLGIIHINVASRGRGEHGLWVCWLVWGLQLHLQPHLHLRFTSIFGSPYHLILYLFLGNNHHLYLLLHYFEKFILAYKYQSYNWSYLHRLRPQDSTLCSRISWRRQ